MASREDNAVGHRKPAGTRLGKREKEASEYIEDTVRVTIDVKERAKKVADINAAKLRDLRR